MRASETNSRAGVGISSVLMILTMLAMAALGVLAYTSTMSAETTTLRSIDVTQEYYAAAAQVQERLMAIDQAVSELPSASEDPAAWLTARKIPDVEWADDDGLSFTITVLWGDDQAIVAKGTAAANGHIRLLSHVLRSLDPPEETKQINLMGVEY